MEIVAVLIGFGSIGKTHAQLLSEITSHLVIIDAKEEAQQKARESFPKAIVAQNMPELDSLGLDWKKVFAIIATWGPSHASLFHFFADRGVKYILCEKPLMVSVKEGYEMLQRTQRENIVLGSHHWFRYIGFGKGLKRLAEEYELGKPQMVLVQGGAKCLVTNGVHNIDLAAEIFETEPTQVISTAKGDPINPRSPELACYGGTAVWSFDNKGEAVIAFNNHSSLAESVLIYYRNAVVHVQNYFANITVGHRDREALAKFPAITRTGSPTEQIFQGVFPEMCSKNEGTKKLYQEILSGHVELCTPTMAFTATSACIGALISGKTKMAVTLPIDPESEFGKQPWPIT